tara:strand:+ start:222 stop:842 length:621 start_codon:yes stop_codon:yes gene_type:complete
MYKNLPNVGIIESKLNKEAMNKLKLYIKNKKNKANHTLAGNINGSFYLEDEDDWFFKNVLISLIKEYSEEERNSITPTILTKNCHHVLNKLWVNFQKKYEFNPIHDHAGVFSFVIWIKIPSSYKKEKKLNFVKECNSPCPNTFEFSYTNTLGKISTYRYHLEPKDEGTILLFSSQLVHLVYPFYLSDKDRISVSGNICLDPTKISQ